MSTHKEHLEKIFGNDAVFTDTRYVGAKCYGKISDILRVRAEFTYLDVVGLYDAIKISIINRNEGEIDSVVIGLGYVLGLKKVTNRNFPDGIYPYMWWNNDKLDWYVYKANPKDYEALTTAVNNYVDVFREHVQEMQSGLEQRFL